VPLESQSKGDTCIGHDVWIGNSVTIMPGITIGNGAIIGSCGVVTKDVESYAIIGDNSAKLIRKRFDDETIKKLCELEWWNWTIEKITQYANAISLGDKELFC
jgi:virginiamycin A acetyltransferase